MGNKKRVLFISEASFLSTGFSTYNQELISRLHQYYGNEFILGEFGSYASTNDPRAKSIPWKFYGAQPDELWVDGKKHINALEQELYEKNYGENQFGKWKLDAVLTDFKPDIVCTNRDNWMDTYIGKTPFRPFFKWIWMACIDGEPQRPEWIDDYYKIDELLTYSKFGKMVLEKEGLKVNDYCPPGVDEIFQPRNKESCRRKVGLPNLPFIGFFSRNQSRKLFPDFILAYKEFISRWGKKFPQEDIPRLLLHTSIPDVGWDIPLEVFRNQLEDFIYFTFVCDSCGNYWVDKFTEEKVPCKRCGRNEGHTPNTIRGISRDGLCNLYNCLDVLVQYTVCEGYGMTLSEAKGCGVPVMAPPFTALEEQVGNGTGGIPIKIASIITSSEQHGHGTMQRRCIPDAEDTIEKLTWFFKARKRNPERIKELSLEAIGFVKDTWEKTTSKWVELLRKVEPVPANKSWHRKQEIYKTDIIIPSGDFSTQVKALYENLLHIPYGPAEEKLTQKLASEGVTIEQLKENFVKRVEGRNRLERMRLFGCVELENIADELDSEDTFRILYAMPESAGDVLLSTATIEGLKKKFPDASIYFSTKDQYAGILKDNPNIKKVLSYEEEVINYRICEGYGKEPGKFDMVFNPYITTQKISDIWHNGRGRTLLGHYAAMCDVTPGKVSIARDQPKFALPEEYITVHTGASYSLKEYGHFVEVISYLKLPVLQLGMEKDPQVVGTIDLRGKTTYQEAAYIIGNSKIHLGVDSFLSHVAAAVGTDVVVLFGATWSSNCAPLPTSGTVITLDPKHRWDCVKPCHLSKCEQISRCVDNILPYDQVVKAIKSLRPELIREVVGV